jgi:2-aminoadipate transaminase
VSPAEILITNGSQQGLDLIGKVFIDRGDRVLMERPGYLGAIQAFEFYEPRFDSVELGETGVNLAEFAEVVQRFSPKLFYAVPNFQNPSGVTYSQDNRKSVTELLAGSNTILVEDDPYGELRFLGEKIPPIKKGLERSILLGSFSKIVAPGLRMGWICASPEIMEQLITAKQAADLHSNYFTQRVLYQYLIDHDINDHIATIRSAYKQQRDLMVQAIAEYFPPEVHCTKPEGGMFLWMTLPREIDAMDLFDIAIQEQVAFVPGQAFFVDGSGKNSLRLNFSNADEAKIITGIQRLARATREMLDKKVPAIMER